jgi:hypothetical protein
VSSTKSTQIHINNNDDYDDDDDNNNNNNNNNNIGAQFRATRAVQRAVLPLCA